MIKKLERIFYNLYFSFCELILKIILRLMGFNNPDEKKNGEFKFINDYLIDSREYSLVAVSNVDAYNSKVNSYTSANLSRSRLPS
jgi:hypothetical protein